jgi:hypothetical protein
MTAAVIGFVAALVEVNGGPQFLIGAHANTATKVVVNDPMWLVSGSQLGFGIAFFLAGLQVIARVEKGRGLAHPVLATNGFLIALGLVALTSLQHLAVAVVEDQSLFDLGVRGTRAAVLLVSRVRSNATWAVGILLLIWLVFTGKQLQKDRWPLLDCLAVLLMGLSALAVLATAGELDDLLAQ